MMMFGNGTPSSEKRKLAEYPDNAKDFRTFTVEFERYFDDRFGLRSSLVSLHHRTKLLLGASPSNKVVIGRNGMLFYTGDKELEDYRHHVPFTESQLAQLRDYLETVHGWLAEHGIKYLFVIPPNKTTVYPEFMPYPAPLKGSKRIDQLIDYLRVHHSAVIPLDLRMELASSKAAGLLYYRTDTHWNYRGGLVGNQAIITALQRQLPGMKPVPSLPNLFVNEEGPGGDLALMLGNPDGFRESYTNVNLQVMRAGGFCIYSLGMISESSPPFTTHCVSQPYRTVVFHDSFFIGMFPFFAASIGEATFLSHRITTSDLRKFALNSHVDVVIDEWLERLLDPSEQQNLVAEELRRDAGHTFYKAPMVNCPSFLDLTSKEGVPFGMLYGFSYIEPIGRWSFSDELLFRCQSDANTRVPIYLQIKLSMAMVSELHKQRVLVSINGKQTNQYLLETNGPSDIEMTIPPSNTGEIEVTIGLPDAITPKKLGINEDLRRLAIAVKSIAMKEVH